MIFFCGFAEINHPQIVISKMAVCISCYGGKENDVPSGCHDVWGCQDDYTGVEE